MYPNRPLLALVLFVSLAGCTADSSAPAAPFEPDPPAPQVPSVGPVAAVFISTDSAFLFGGTSQQLAVYVLDAKGKTVPNKLVVWTSTNRMVADVATTGDCGPTAITGCYRTSVYARNEGAAVITATVDGVKADMKVVVRIPMVEAQGVTVDFSVVELAGPSYAPLVTVAETTGKRSLEILSIGIKLPPFTWEVRCTGATIVGPGQAVPMFPSFYGEHFLVISGGPARTSDDAVATVYLRDESGDLLRKEVTGKISTTYVLPPQIATHTANWQCG